jgi:hypothetical protein
MENKLTASELRIGNRVKRGNDIVEVNLISENEFGLKNINSMYPITICELEPIPLTEEWLLKFGFEVKNFDYNIIISECGVVSMQLIPQDEKCSSFSVCVIQSDEDELDSYVFLSDIKNVHQLQNLYFALTNKELTIK